MNTEISYEDLVCVIAPVWDVKRFLIGRNEIMRDVAEGDHMNHAYAVEKLDRALKVLKPLAEKIEEENPNQFG